MGRPTSRVCRIAIAVRSASCLLLFPATEEFNKGHLTSKEAWATVDLDTMTGRVFVQQDWYYDWRVWTGVQPWTYREKSVFHKRVDRAIWGAWSNHLFINVTGKAPFSTRRIPVNFDARWKLSGHSNYRVEAWKVPPGSSPTSPIWSEVLFGDYIRLSTAHIQPRGAGNAAGQSTSNFVTPPHEFGHTIGAPDEYNNPTPSSPNPYLGDTDSIMNIGCRVRARHLALLTQTLHKMVPGAQFTA